MYKQKVGHDSWPTFLFAVQYIIVAKKTQGRFCNTKKTDKLAEKSDKTPTNGSEAEKN